MKQKKLAQIMHEFQHHFPFTIASCLATLIGLGVYTELLLPTLNASHPTLISTAGFSGFFHILHPVHVFLSAAATAAMFWQYDRRLIAAVLVGFCGSVSLCALSDIIFPFVGGKLLTTQMDLHLCVAEHPALVLSFSIMGVATGIFGAAMLHTRTISTYTHASHVVVSTAATVIYLIGFGLTNWIPALVPVFIILVFSVIIPCCASDIFFPLMLISPEKFEHWCLGTCKEDSH